MSDDQASFVSGEEAEYTKRLFMRSQGHMPFTKDQGFRVSLDSDKECLRCGLPVRARIHTGF